MENHWKCKCGEDVPNDYVECWNCQSFRPGYSTPAQQVSDYDRQTKRADEIQDEMERQNKRVDELQDDMERQNKRADEIMEKSMENETRLSKLIDRYETIAEKLERRLDN